MKNMTENIKLAEVQLQRGKIVKFFTKTNGGVSLISQIKKSVPKHKRNRFFSML